MLDSIGFRLKDLDCFTTLPMTDFCIIQNISGLIIRPSSEWSCLRRSGFVIHSVYLPWICNPNKADSLLVKEIHTDGRPFQGPATSVIYTLCPNFFGVITQNDKKTLFLRRALLCSLPLPQLAAHVCYQVCLITKVGY